MSSITHVKVIKMFLFVAKMLSKRICGSSLHLCQRAEENHQTGAAQVHLRTKQPVKFSKIS